MLQTTTADADTPGIRRSHNLKESEVISMQGKLQVSAATG
jgi:hypothetical protein